MHHFSHLQKQKMSKVVIFFIKDIKLKNIVNFSKDMKFSLLILAWKPFLSFVYVVCGEGLYCRKKKD